MPSPLAEPRLPPLQRFSGPLLGNGCLEGTGTLLFKLHYVRRGVQRVFDHPLSGRQASKKLLTLRQNNGSATEYAIQFRTIAAGSGWNDESLMVCFLNGLSEAIKDDLATREPARDLETLIDQAIRLDNRLRERNLNRPFVSTLSASPTPVQMLPVPQDSPEPMQLGRTQLSPSERDRRMRERCCLYCGLYGHFRSTCPELSGNARSCTGKEGL
ncbi:hypothetical protein QTP70_009070 [Hemibagrus guttatus]|uniref:CCHC-type domain-containing protein n=1 Tax=Hemibagrus guttatus TaxID=175788 RepID=A0AAE0RJK2_9TELE|nr:hypothetical protein QTP70_009070 [Hemibagrus guttatus]